MTNLSGVPSWMLAVIKRVLEKTGATHLNEVWPNLEVFFHGGVCFTPYREQYKQLITSPKMHYMETYNASEGFFGLQSNLADPAMLLMIDYDVFYEFIPLEEIDNPNPHIVPLTGIEVGRNYAMVISTSCGLWRYIIGDTVKFTQKTLQICHYGTHQALHQCLWRRIDGRQCRKGACQSLCRHGRASP